MFLSILYHNEIQLLKNTKITRQKKRFCARYQQSIRLAQALDVQPAELKPNDLTIVLTLSAKVLDVIFLPGTWNGFETASTYAAWNLLKNCTVQ